jgi:hypothetical protein
MVWNVEFYFEFKNLLKGTLFGNIVQVKKQKTFVNFVNKLFKAKNRHKFGFENILTPTKTNYYLLILKNL